MQETSWADIGEIGLAMKAGETRMEKSPPPVPIEPAESIEQTETAPLSRVAQYVRMSTEHQQYSTENQADIIQRYAESRKMEIVETYADHGRSGLNIAGRDGLSQLVADVEKGEVAFSEVLVYDVSRWGRFQDVDESAYYEYVLKRAGVRVHYCAEQFENDGSMYAAVVKAVKRSMAGEYSRELSVKVFAGQCRLIELGFRQGGPPGFGLRRQLIDRDGNSKGLLGRGERKSLQTDRVILVPGPEQEVEVVREIYVQFVEQRKTERQIMDNLNGRGVTGEDGRAWTRATVHQVLTNPKYIGANIFNRRSFKLKRKRVKNPMGMWIWRDNAFQPIVSAQQFHDARKIIDARHQHLSDEELLDRLRTLLQQRGRLSGVLIDECEDMPPSSSYCSRFGNLLRAYQLIGWDPERDFSYIEINRQLRQKHAGLVDTIIADLQSLGAAVTVDSRNQLLTINTEYSVSLVLARCRETRAGSHRWQIRFERSFEPDITIAARLAPGNQQVLDYYLFPGLDEFEDRLRLAPRNGLLLDVHRHDNLDLFFQLTRRVTLKEPE
jgi:DNA invertase Pin-like site-specific DNA recombinase